MSKKDFRVWCDSEYKQYLQLLAEQQGISLNKLVLDLVEKKYPFNKKAKAILKNATLQNCEVANTHTVDAGCDLSADGEQVSLDAPSLTASAPADAVVLESVETHSSDVEITVTPEVNTTAPEVANGDDYAFFENLLSKGSEPHLFTKKERKAMKNRITTINNKINTAKETGNHIPAPEYAKLVEQKKALIPIVYPDNKQPK